MGPILIVVISVAIIVLAIVLIIHARRKVQASDNMKICVANIDSVSRNEIIVPIELLSSAMDIDDKQLFEITDHSIIARISDAIPGAAEALAKTITNKALKKVELYRLDIPSAALAKSKEAEGAFRAFLHGKNSISKNANLFKADPSKISKASTIANSAANIMNVASLVVGQYYMSEINTKLDTMSKTVDKIREFQDQEFRSKILMLIPRVGEISIFSSEILDSEEKCNRKLQTLEDLKGEGTQLLQQVNIAISDSVKKNPKPDYNKYQKVIEDFSVLIEQQRFLLSILEEISKLTYLLGKGKNSTEMCYSIYSAYLAQSNEIRTVLIEWHDEQVASLGIDIDKNQKRKSGIEGFFAAIPGFVDEKWNYKALKNGLGQKINSQITTNQSMSVKPIDVYDNDIKIIIRDGKYYYLAGEVQEH
jgi:hypothetical protein